MSTYSKKRKDDSGGGSPPRRSSKRIKAIPPPTLVSLRVTWAPDDNAADAFSFHITATATLSRVGGVSISQEFCDGLSIRAGTDPGNLQFRMTVFLPDQTASTQSPETLSVSFDDYPGYDDEMGIQADTDLKYVFGAKWKVTWNGRVLATTTPLFGTVSGTGPARTFTPAASVTATWNNSTGTWANQGTLVGAFPAWGIYPTPAVNNTLEEEDSD